MEKVKVYIQYVMLWEFKIYKNPTETVKNISCVYGQGVITDRQVRDWFTKFHSGDMSLRNEPRPGRSTNLN